MPRYRGGTLISFSGLRSIPLNHYVSTTYTASNLHSTSLVFHRFTVFPVNLKIFCAATGGNKRAQSFGRSRGGCNTKAHMVARMLQRP
jgi:hypothetical protein